MTQGWIQTKQTPHIIELGPRTLRPSGLVGSNTLDLVYQLGLEDQVLTVSKDSPAAKNRFILYNEKLEMLPNSLVKFLFSSSPVLKGLIGGLLLEPFRPRGIHDSIASFITRRIDERVYSNLVSAVIHGIYAGDASKLELESILPSLARFEREHGSILLGGVLSSFKSVPKYQSSSREAQLFIENVQKSSIYSFKQGMQTLSDALVQQLPTMGVELIQAKCTNLDIYVSTVEIQAQKTENLKADFIVSALPAAQLASLVPSSTFKDTLGAISSVSVAVVNLVYRGRLIKTPGFGFLVPISQVDKAGIIGVVYDSCAMPQQEKGEWTRLTCMIGGHLFEKLKLSQDPLAFKTHAIAAVEKYLGISSANLAQDFVHYHQACIPQYTIGHQQRLANLDEYLQGVPFALVGASYRGVSINDIIYNSRLTAEKIAGS